MKNDLTVRINGMIAVILFSVLTGCSTKVEQSKIPADVPQTWNFERSVSELPISNGILSVLKNEDLKQFVEDVLQNNADYQAMNARYNARLHRLGVSRSQLLPSLNASGQYMKNNQSVDPLSGSVGDGKRIRIGAELSWELDLWGKLKQLNQADQASVRAYEWELKAMKDSIIARAIQMWIQAASLEKSLEIADQRIKTLEAIQVRMQDRYAEGIGEVSDLDSARTRLLLGRAEYSELKSSYQEILRDMELMTGQYVGHFPDRNYHFPEIPLPELLSPQTVLFQRPDVQVALANLDAANLQEISIRKQNLPSLFLSADIAKEHISWDDFFDQKNVWSWALNFSKNLFDGGLTKSRKLAANWETQASVCDLRSSVLNAVKEIYDRYDMHQKLHLQRSFYKEALVTSENSYKYYERRYLDGLDPIILMLNAKEEFFSVSVQLNETTAAVLINRIDMILAMGSVAEQ